MTQRATCLLATFALCLLLPPVAMTQELVVAPDSAQGIYEHCIVSPIPTSGPTCPLG